MKQSLVNYIDETIFDTYRGYIRVTYKQEVGITELAELLRALPGVTTVTPVEGNKNAEQEIYKIKIITQKTGREAFESFRTNALKRYNLLSRVEIATQTIQKVA